eukprot:SAG11_NODE_3421_length_2457_cov_5.526718_2_plen_145_part_00
MTLHHAVAIAAIALLDLGAGSAATIGSDTLLDKYFCGIYYPRGVAAANLPPCSHVKAAVKSDLTTPLPTLSLGDPAKPALFFVHGWPDSAAEFAAQFGGLCYGPTARYRCVAATWQNFHPDLPDAQLQVRALICEQLDTWHCIS